MVSDEPDAPSLGLSLGLSGLDAQPETTSAVAATAAARANRIFFEMSMHVPFRAGLAVSDREGSRKKFRRRRTFGGVNVT